MSLTKDQVSDFIDALGMYGLHTMAADAAGVDLLDVHRSLARGEHNLPELQDLALLRFKERTYRRIYERAVIGIEEDVYYRGEIVGTKTVYSDSLAARILDRITELPTLQDLRPELTKEEQARVEVLIQGLGEAAREVSAMQKEAD